ncbi:MAG TPA: NAD(P)-dependent oxidoreductase [Acetobacteraceae bacterium]|nr:NAD(P)-dependent oxidoreductase [Acetobacteraceae bacterium]
MGGAHTVLVTGASGRLGSRVAAMLAAEGFRLRLTDLRAPAALPEGAEFTPADLTDPAPWPGLLAGCRAVLHFGGIPNETPGPEAIEAVNIRGTRHVYEAARLARARVVFASSNHVVGFHARPAPGAPRLHAGCVFRPDTHYGLSKMHGEGLARLYWDKHGVESVVVRIGSCTEAPTDARMLSTWLSPRDLAALCRCATEAAEVGCAVVWGASANPASFWGDDDRARIGWHPKDSAKPWQAALEGLRSGDPVAEHFQGGAFCALGREPARLQARRKSP